jgi:PhzF family phenazine biosynthesis protein
MKIPIYQVDAFTSTLFRGNPAAVCPLQTWLPDAQMQAIAAENNLSETAFFVQRDDLYELRWFRPVDEAPLCGHATLASAHVIFQYLNPALHTITFSTKSGLLTVTREQDRLAMDFPALPASPCPAPDGLAQALGVSPDLVLVAPKYVAVYTSERIVRALRPDMTGLMRLDRSVIVTAPGDTVDFVSRTFAPKVGVPEDPVTGASHCTLVPYWSKRLSKTTLHAFQVSPRGGELFCEDLGERVKLAGRAVTYLEGHILIA